MNTTFETGRNGSVAETHDWLTPPELLSVLGPFDLDPCASQFQPWRTAAQQFTIEDDGLSRAWAGRVWCNPPYGPYAARFLQRCAEHGNAVALIFARTDTQAFQQWCWRSASAMLFLEGRLAFRRPDGKEAGRAGAPSVLVAYGQLNAEVLKRCGLPGYFVALPNAAPEASPQMELAL